MRIPQIKEPCVVVDVMHPGQLLLDGGIEDYEYLNKSRREIDGVNDKEEWRQLKVSLLHSKATIYR